MAEFHTLVRNENPLILDDIQNQLEDLAGCRFPAEKLEGMPTDAILAKLLHGQKPDEFANWVYFPWKNTAVKILKKEHFIECRTNRNKLKITDAEQAILGSKNILFIGLSVGQSAALTFAMQRIGGHLHLADFDTLSLSNMNRLRASVIDIGRLKSVIAARQIAEQDPYLSITCHNHGVTTANIDDLLSQNGKGNVDLVVEECDSLEIKFLVREKAKSLRIPVIMETSDKGVVDIERYDLEPETSIFNGLVDGLNFETVQTLNPKERFEVLAKLVDINRVSDGLRKSYAALGKEVSTWPQLGYEVTLGGATLAFTAFKILLQKNMKSGRIYVDLDAVFEQRY